MLLLIQFFLLCLELLILALELFVLILDRSFLLIEGSLLVQKLLCVFFLKSDLVISLLDTLVVAFLGLKKGHTHDQHKKQKDTCHHIRIRTPDIKTVVF